MRGYSLVRGLSGSNTPSLTTPSNSSLVSRSDYAPLSAGPATSLARDGMWGEPLASSSKAGEGRSETATPAAAPRPPVASGRCRPWSAMRSAYPSEGLAVAPLVSGQPAVYEVGHAGRVRGRISQLAGEQRAVTTDRAVDAADPVMGLAACAVPAFQEPAGSARIGMQPGHREIRAKASTVSRSRWLVAATWAPMLPPPVRGRFR